MTVANLVAERESVPRSLAARAYELLVREITRLELAPGEVLADKALTERFDIGRTPLREALQRLAREGLVVHLPNRGMFVSEITADSVQQIYEFRALIDGHAVRLAATCASASEMDDLTALQEALVDATERDDIDTFVVMDRLFYEVLAQSARNVYLAEVIPRIFNLPPATVVLHLEEDWRLALHCPLARGDDARRRGRDSAAQPQRSRDCDEDVHRAPAAGHARAALTLGHDSKPVAPASRRPPRTRRTGRFRGSTGQRQRRPEHPFHHRRRRRVG